jgi:hypothetical protein
MKNIQNHAVGTVPNSNNIVETKTNLIPLTHIYMATQFTVLVQTLQ